MALPTFRNEDEEAQYCLSVLRDGTREQKIVARERLAAIFTRRGLYEEAAELYELNIRAGVRSPELVEQLSATYRHLGDLESAEAALAEARRLRAASAPRSGPDSAPSAPDSPESASDSPPIVSAEPRVIPFPGPSAPLQPERTPSVAASPGSHRSHPVPIGGHIASAAARAAQVVTDPVLEDEREPHVARADTARLPAQQPPEPTTVPEFGHPDQPGPSRRALHGPLLAIGVVLFLIVLPVVLLALLVINPLSLYLEGRAAGPLVDTRAAEAPTLKVAPGASATWYLLTGRSVSGLWATPGLDLSLAQELDGAGTTFGVTAPRAQTWGETITIVERRGQGRSNQETVVPATFAAPDSLPSAGTVLEGRIAGQVTAPRLSENSQFNTTTQNVDFPVRLVVVSTLDLWVDRFWNTLRMFFDEDRWLLVTIGAILSWCVLAGVAAVLFRTRRT